MRIRAITVLACGLMLAACAPGGDPAPTIEPHEKLAGLAAYIESSFDDWDVPGLAVGVVYEGKIVYAQGFVIKQSGRDEPVDADTLFQIGSVSKSFGAAAIGTLVDDGKLSWDDPVVQHLPWFETSDPEFTQKLTVRDLLAHRSGIPEDLYPALEVMSGREAAERIRKLDNYGAYGTHRYSNIGYGLLGLIVEEVTGQSWSEWTKQRLFEPLGMRHSAGSPLDIWDAAYVAPTFLGTATGGEGSIDNNSGRNVAMPHGVDRDGARRILDWQSYDNMQAAGSVVSSALEMTRWLQLHLGDGTVDGHAVLGQETLNELHTAQVASTGSFIFAEAAETSYGMGWEINQFGGSSYLYHGGGIFGFPAYVAMMPEINAGVVVLANGSMWTPYYPHQEISAWVFAQLLALEERDWHSETMQQIQAIQAMADQGLAAFAAMKAPDAAWAYPLPAYVGTYRDVHGGELIVEESDDGLQLRFIADGSFSGSLEPMNPQLALLYFDGGDGQALSRAPASFVFTDESVTTIDLGRMGRYERVE